MYNYGDGGSVKQIIMPDYLQMCLKNCWSQLLKNNFKLNIKWNNYDIIITC